MKTQVIFEYKLLESRFFLWFVDITMDLLLRWAVQFGRHFSTYSKNWGLITAKNGEIKFNKKKKMEKLKFQ